MKKQSSNQKLDKKLKSFNHINRSEHIKQRSYHQIMNRLNEKKQAPSSSFTFAKFVSPIILGLITVGMIFFLITVVQDEEPYESDFSSSENDDDKKPEVPLFAYNEFDPLRIGIGDQVADMTLADGEFTEFKEGSFLTKGTFKGELKLSGEIYHKPEGGTYGNRLLFRPDEESLALLPRPYNYERLSTFFITDQEWIRQTLQSSPDMTFYVSFTIDQYELFTLGSDRLNILRVTSFDRAYTKAIQESDINGTYINEKYGYTFTIPKQWENNFMIEEIGSKTSIWHVCTKEDRRQLYLEIYVSEGVESDYMDENRSPKAKEISSHNGLRYSYRTPLDVAYTNESCAQDYYERSTSAFNNKTITDYFQTK